MFPAFRKNPEASVEVGHRGGAGVGAKAMRWGLGRSYLVAIQGEVSGTNWLELWGQI